MAAVLWKQISIILVDGVLRNGQPWRIHELRKGVRNTMYQPCRHLLANARNELHVYALYTGKGDLLKKIAKAKRDGRPQHPPPLNPPLLGSCSRYKEFSSDDFFRPQVRTLVMISTGLTGGRQLSSGLRNECNHVVEDTIPHVPAAVRLFWGSVKRPYMRRRSITWILLQSHAVLRVHSSWPIGGLRYFIETHW